MLKPTLGCDMHSPTQPLHTRMAPNNTFKQPINAPHLVRHDTELRKVPIFDQVTVQKHEELGHPLGHELVVLLGEKESLEEHLRGEGREEEERRHV